jgi:zinc/manganese transport system substrate-binding protein
MKALLLLVSLLAGVLAQADPVKIVAAENFYGGVAAQIAGKDATVTSIMSNPNQDPHEFTTDASTAKAVAEADIVIYSGIGYDDWMTKLLGTAGKKNRVVLCVADLIGAKNGDNPHIWYDPRTMPALADKLAAAIFATSYSADYRDAAGANPFSNKAIAFDAAMKPELDEITEIKAQYAGTTVTATEPVFGYMASALGFKMLNYDFQINIMNDTEPSAAQTIAFEKNLNPKTVKILFYNKQVTDPTTERLKKLAIASGVPIVGVTETQPTDQKTYVAWMMYELRSVREALLNVGFKDNVPPILKNPLPIQDEP